VPSSTMTKVISEMDAEQLFEEKVMEQNRELDADPVGAQKLNDQYHIFLDDHEEDKDGAVVLRLDQDQIDKLQGYLNGVNGDSGE